MFWRLNYQQSSQIDSLLDRADITLENVLEEEEVLQEVKSQHRRLIDLLPHLGSL
jgi:serine/threonine-protein phosphatase 6 regulatory subunit 3